MKHPDRQTSSSALILCTLLQRTYKNGGKRLTKKKKGKKHRKIEWRAEMYSGTEFILDVTLPAYALR
jgi:hypothetical protein